MRRPVRNSMRSASKGFQGYLNCLTLRGSAAGTCGQLVAHLVLPAQAEAGIWYRALRGLKLLLERTPPTRPSGNFRWP
jgi:hypothetical protein